MPILLEKKHLNQFKQSGKSVKKDFYISKIFFPLVLTFFISTNACSNVFYQPSSELFYHPSQFDLTHEEVFFNSKDGTPLHGWFFPVKPQVSERGTVIQFHGNAENISTHFLSLSWLVKYGYNLFTFDYRGYGKSEGSPSQAKIHMDALAALKYAIEINQGRTQIYGKHLIEPKGEKNLKLIAFGQSIGGTILLKAYGDFEGKKEYDAIVIESSFLSYKEIAKEKLSLTWLTWPFQPLAYLMVSDRFSPLKTLEKIAPIPLLVIHGDDDAIVPFYYGKKIFEKATGPKWFWHIKGGKHIGSMSFQNGLYRKKLLKFFEDL